MHAYCVNFRLFNSCPLNVFLLLLNWSNQAFRCRFVTIDNFRMRYPLTDVDTWINQALEAVPIKLHSSRSEQADHVALKLDFDQNVSDRDTWSNFYELLNNKNDLERNAEIYWIVKPDFFINEVIWVDYFSMSSFCLQGLLWPKILKIRSYCYSIHSPIKYQNI